MDIHIIHSTLVFCVIGLVSLQYCLLWKIVGQMGMVDVEIYVEATGLIQVVVISPFVLSAVTLHESDDDFKSSANGLLVPLFDLMSGGDWRLIVERQRLPPHVG